MSTDDQSTVIDGQRKLHASIPSHLSTELELLSGLINRSKFQHRSQPFLQRMREVQRLGRRVDEEVKRLPGTDASEGALLSLVPKFIHCLLRASVSTQQIIDLEQFLPTHISVLAIYARLFALAANVAQALSLDMKGILAGTDGSPSMRGPAETTASVADIHLEDSLPPAQGAVTSKRTRADIDMGQKIERPVPVPLVAAPTISPARLPEPAPSPSPSPSASASPPTARAALEDSPDPDFPPGLAPPAPAPSRAAPAPAPPKKNKKRADPESSNNPIKADANKRPKKAKKKRNDIDDIFGI